MADTAQSKMTETSNDINRDALLRKNVEDSLQNMYTKGWASGARAVISLVKDEIDKGCSIDELREYLLSAIRIADGADKGSENASE